MGPVQETQLLTQNEGKEISLSTYRSSNIFFPGKYGGAVERLATAVRWAPVVVRVRVDGGGGWAEREGEGEEIELWGFSICSKTLWQLREKLM